MSSLSCPSGFFFFSSMLPIGEVALKRVYKIPNQFHVGESPGFEAKPNYKSRLGRDSSGLLWVPSPSSLTRDSIAFLAPFCEDSVRCVGTGRSLREFGEAPRVVLCIRVNIMGYKKTQSFRLNIKSVNWVSTICWTLAVSTYRNKVLKKKKKKKKLMVHKECSGVNKWEVIQAWAMCCWQAQRRAQLGLLYLEVVGRLYRVLVFMHLMGLFYTGGCDCE